MNIQTVSQRFRSVQCFVWEIFEEMFTQIYKAMYGDAMFVSLGGAQIWRPEANKNICHRVFYKEPVAVFLGLINIYIRTYSLARTVQIVKSQRISYFFSLHCSILGRHFDIAQKLRYSTLLCQKTKNPIKLEICKKRSLQMF